MNLLQFLSGWPANQAKIDSLATEISALRQSLTAESTSKTALEAEITGLRSQLSAEQAINLELKTKADVAEQKAASLTEQVAAAEQKAATAEATAAIKVGTAIGATMGVPVALAPGANASGDKPNFSTLRGIEKVIAIEKWEAEQLKNNLPKN